MQGWLFTVARTIGRFTRLKGTIRRVFLGVIVVASGSMLSACASLPSQEMSDARRALDAALQADARRMLPLELARATAKLQGANDALRVGHYDEARELARAVRDEAIAARVLASRLVHVQGVMATARAQGRGLQDIDVLIRRALEMSRAGDSSGALAIVEQAATSLR